MLIKNLEETIKFGHNFSLELKAKSIILLKGQIGAGKTSLVKGIAEGLQIKENIASPTFALSHHYNSGKLPLIHMDLYRLEETIKFGHNFSLELKAKSIILLKGQIGAGKTSLVKGIAEGLQIKENITSPTFALSHHYNSGKLPLIHMDLYRLEDTVSAKELFLEEEEELEQNNGIMIIEWPEKIISIVDEYWLIEINYWDDSGRILKIYEPNDFMKS